MNIFANDLIEMAKPWHIDYQEAKPFPHVVIDGLINQVALQAAVDAFPNPEALDFYRYDNLLEKKLAFDQVSALPMPIANILWAMNAPFFLRFLEELTGIMEYTSRAKTSVFRSFGYIRQYHLAVTKYE